MIVILSREDLLTQKRNLPIGQITINDVREEMHSIEVVIFIEKLDNKFNYRELKNRYDVCWQGTDISEKSLGENLTEIVNRENYDTNK